MKKLNAVTESSKRICKVDGCGKPHNAKGYCKLHYNKYLRNLPPENSDNVCKVEGCNRRVVAKGHCMNHYYSRKRSKGIRQPKTYQNNEVIIKIDALNYASSLIEEGKISRKDLAAELGIQRPRLSEYLNGKRELPLYIRKSIEMHRRLSLINEAWLKAVKMVEEDPENPLVLEAYRLADQDHKYINKKRYPLKELFFLFLADLKEGDFPFSR